MLQIPVQAPRLELVAEGCVQALVVLGRCLLDGVFKHCNTPIVFRYRHSISVVREDQRVEPHRVLRRLFVLRIRTKLHRRGIDPLLEGLVCAEKIITGHVLRFIDDEELALRRHALTSVGDGPQATCVDGAINLPFNIINSNIEKLVSHPEL